MDQPLHTLCPAAYLSNTSVVEIVPDTPLHLPIIVDSCILGVQSALHNLFGRCATVTDLGMKTSAPDSMIFRCAEEGQWAAILTTDMRDCDEYDMTCIARAKAQNHIKNAAQAVFGPAHFANVDQMTRTVRGLRAQIEQGELGQNLATLPIILHVPKSVFVSDPAAGRRSDQLAELCARLQVDIHAIGTAQHRPSYCAMLTGEGIKFPATSYLNLLANVLYNNAADLVFGDEPGRSDKGKARVVRDDMKTAICRVLGNNGKRSAEADKLKTHYVSKHPTPACA